MGSALHYHLIVAILINCTICSNDLEYLSQVQQRLNSLTFLLFSLDMDIHSSFLSVIDHYLSLVRTLSGQEMKTASVEFVITYNRFSDGHRKIKDLMSDSYELLLTIDRHMYFNRRTNGTAMLFVDLTDKWEEKFQDQLRETVYIVKDTTIVKSFSSKNETDENFEVFKRNLEEYKQLNKYFRKSSNGVAREQRYTNPESWHRQLKMEA